MLYPWKRLAAAIVLLTIAACGTKANSAATTPSTEAAPKSVAATTPECSGSCDTQHTCVRAREDQLCACETVAHVSCGGIEQPNYELPGAPRPRQWVCRPLHPARDRGDGCPFAAPSSQAACSGSQVCNYQIGPCGWTIDQWTCVDKHWVQGPSLHKPIPH